MNRLLILLLTAGSSIAAGFAIGRLMAPEATAPGAVAEAPGERGAASEAASAESGPPPPAVRGDGFENAVEQFLAALAGSDEAGLAALLEKNLADRSLPPELARFFRDAVIGRLIDLGAAEEVARAGGADAREREEMLGVVAGRIALRDPDAAEAMVLDLPAGQDRQVAMRTFLEVLGGRDPARGVAFLRAHPEGREAGSHFFNAWAAQNPQAANESALALDRELGASFLHSALHRWAMDDPAGAWQWIARLPPGQRDPARSAYMNGLVNKDPAFALDAVLANPELASAGFGDWIGRALAQDVASADAVLDRAPPGDFRMQLVGGMANGLLQTDPDAALAWAETLLPGERDAAVRQIFETLARDDPESAVALAASSLEGPAAEKAIAAAAGEWANQDFAGAFAALTKHLDGGALKRVLPSVLKPNYMLIGQDFGKRLVLFAELEPGVRQEVLRTTGTQWGMVNPHAVREHLAGMDPGDRAALAEGLITGISSSAPGLAAEFAAYLPPERQLANARRISEAIAFQDSQAAADFLNRLPVEGAGTARQQAMQGLVREWAYENPTAASAFVASLPPGGVRDAVALELARQLRNFDLDGATRVLAGVSTPATRTKLIQELANAWARADASRGKALLAPLLLSSEDRRSTSALMESR